MRGRGRHRPGGRALRLVAVLSAATVLGGCTVPGRARAPERPLPRLPATVDVEMSEYAFAYAPPVRAGRVVFRVGNSGRLPHDLVLLQLPAGLPPLDAQLRSETRRVAPIVATLPARAPGSNAAFAVDLGPGRYGVVCFVTDPDGQQHSRKGMSSEFSVG